MSRWMSPAGHRPPPPLAQGLPIGADVAIRLVKLGTCSAADIGWLRAAGARWHPRDGSLSLPAHADGGHAGARPSRRPRRRR